MGRREPFTGVRTSHQTELIGLARDAILERLILPEPFSVPADKAEGCGLLRDELAGSGFGLLRPPLKNRNRSRTNEGWRL